MKSQAFRISVRLLLGGLIGLATATVQGQSGGRGGESVTAALVGQLRVESPVPLNGPFPAVVRKATVDDRILLQVSYASRPVFPQVVTAKVAHRGMSALEVIHSHSPLFLLKNGEQGTGVAGSHFAVLLKANSAGGCKVEIKCEMSDGSTKVVPFEFNIEAHATNSRAKPELCEGKYSAQQVPGAVIIFAAGAHLTSGYETFFEQLPIDIFPPQYRLMHVKPDGFVSQVITPFFVYTSFPANRKIDEVVIHDASGEHKVKVEQVPDLK